MWFLQSEALAEIKAARSLAAPATSEQQATFTAARARQSEGEAPAGLTVAGDTAQINVVGVLVPQLSFMLWMLGISQTAYGEIREALARAASDASVKRVSLFVNSPGGNIDGLFNTLAALEAFGKPISVIAECACSAAYAIAALAGPITAANPASQFGSIGVAASVPVDDDVVNVTSTEAPNKRPDVSTEEGRAIVREQLDAVHDLFVDAIARSRGTNIANVNANYGRGGTLLAGAAKQRGMIDGVAAPAKRVGTRGGAASADQGPMTRAALDAFERREPAIGESLTAFAERSMHAAEVAADTRDLGDIVAAQIDAEIDAQLSSQGRSRGKSIATYSEPLVLEMRTSPKLGASSPGFDMGDAVVAVLDAKKLGTKPPVFTSPATQESAADLGDLVADRIEASASTGKTHHLMSR